MTNKIREFSHPLRGLDDLPGDPSTKVPGYFHFVRCADDNYQTFRAKLLEDEMSPPSRSG